MIALIPAIKRYAWGPHTSIQQLCGNPPTSYPIAEYWFGAHEAGGSLCADGATLDARIRSNPAEELGHQILAQNGPRLPFLVKLIAAERPLSLQAHPSKQEAARGFAEEEALRISRTAPHRNYRDTNHKPEMVIALSEFDALVGFRDPEGTVDFLDALAAPLMSPYRSLLSSRPNNHGIYEVYDSLTSRPSNDLQEIIAQVASRARSYIDTLGMKAHWAVEAATAHDLALRYPTDPGVLAALLLNRVSLERGQAIFLGAGQLHAYLRGTAVEVMANSDNVLRGGLTAKHVDARELKRILSYSPSRHPAESADAVTNGIITEKHYRSRVQDFSLSCLEMPGGLSGYKYSPKGPEILLSAAGSIEIRASGAPSTIGPGEAMWIPASTKHLRLSTKTDTTIYRTRTGYRDPSDPTGEGSGLDLVRVDN